MNWMERYDVKIQTDIQYFHFPDNPRDWVFLTFYLPWRICEIIFLLLTECQNIRIQSSLVVC